MKKRYIIVPVACILALIAIIIAVAVILNTGYLKKLSYDHMNDAVYNGVEVVGDDGLFYLVKDGKKVSRGYVSLQSVNDFYATDSDGIIKAAKNGKSVVLFDYYLARGEESSEYMLVNSSGEEVTVLGESLSLDSEKTCLPYLVFTDNSNGRRCAVSLHCLDSDLSYKSGNELILRPFKSVTPDGKGEDTELCSYLVTEDITDEPQISYFTSNGIKITSGDRINKFSLYSKTAQKESIYLHNAVDGKLFGINGEIIATDVEYIARDTATDWRYAFCQDGQAEQQKIVVFSPQRTIGLLSDNYRLDTLWTSDGCVVVQKADETGFDIINVNTARISTYQTAVPNGSVITATDKSGSFCYINGEGFEILTGKYGDMTPIEALSNKSCTVFSSVGYNEDSGKASYCHFAAAGKDVYTLEIPSNTVLEKVSFASTSDFACYILSETVDEKVTYTVLSPFSTVKNETVYQSIEAFCQNGVCWMLGTSYESGVYDIIDPLSGAPVASFKCAEEDFARYVFEHTAGIALATNKNDSETAVHMTVIKLTKYERDDLMSNTKHIILYRPLPIAFAGYNTLPLDVLNLGGDLLIDEPISVYTDKNYLVANKASGSCIYALDTESYILGEVCTLPYQTEDIITDSADTSVHYFKVKNNGGLMGLYGEDAEAVLTPYYGDILYAEKGYFTVKLKDAWGVIRAKKSGIKTVIDFMYESISPLGDNGYLAINGERTAQIFSGKRVVLAEPLQSCKSIYSYKADESGLLTVSKMILISADASLYIHRSEQKLDLTFGRYDGIQASPEGVLNSRATVIYYYEGEECIHTQVVYPDSNAPELYGFADGREWYLSARAEEQTAGVAWNDIAATGKKIIRLYSKVE